MRVVTKQERGTAMQAKNITGIPDGTWLVNLEGHNGTMALTGEEFERRFVEDTTEATVPRAIVARRANGGEKLEVPPAREGWNKRPVSDRILATVTAEPMTAKDLIAAVDSNPKHASNVRSAIARLVKRGELKTPKRGTYQLGGKR